jgi:hypothetical protein
MSLLELFGYCGVHKTTTLKSWGVLRPCIITELGGSGFIAYVSLNFTLRLDGGTDYLAGASPLFDAAR